jgi:uncharacterized membrane protein (DUF106 family)
MQKVVRRAYKLHQKRYVLGICLLLASFFPYILPVNFKTGLMLTLLYAFYCLGIALVSDHICEKLTGQSMLNTIVRAGKGRWYYFLIALVGGLVLEGTATYFGGIWHYPFYSLSTYFIITVVLGGFGWYFLCILLSYQAVKDILDKITKGRRFVGGDYSYEQWLYPSLLIMGLIGLGVFLAELWSGTDAFRSFVLSVTNEKTPYISFAQILWLNLWLFFIFEYIEHRRHRTSLLKDTMHGYLNPLLAILIVSVILGLYMEWQNVPIGLWIYKNWPWQHITFGHIPIMVFVAWPLHYVFFLSLYRALGDRRSREIWSGDAIE